MDFERRIGLPSGVIKRGGWHWWPSQEWLPPKWDHDSNFRPRFLQTFFRCIPLNLISLESKDFSTPVVPSSGCPPCWWNPSSWAIPVFANTQHFKFCPFYQRILDTSTTRTWVFFVTILWMSFPMISLLYPWKIQKSSKCHVFPGPAIHLFSPSPDFPAPSAQQLHHILEALGLLCQACHEDTLIPRPWHRRRSSDADRRGSLGRNRGGWIWGFGWNHLMNLAGKGERIGNSQVY